MNPTFHRAAIRRILAPLGTPLPPWQQPTIPAPRRERFVCWLFGHNPKPIFEGKTGKQTAVEVDQQMRELLATGRPLRFTKCARCGCER